MSARETAATYGSELEVVWRQLEEAAFAAHPSVTVALNARANGRRRRVWEYVAIVPVGLVMVFFAAAPILGLAAISRNPYQNYTAPAEDMIPLAGVFFGSAFVWIAGWLIAWAITNRRYSGVATGYAVLTLVLGGITAVALPIRGREDDVAAWEQWLIVVIAAMAIATAFIAVQLVARVRFGTGRVGITEHDERLMAVRKQAVEQLSEADRAEVRRDLDGAVLDLQSRGLITESVAEWARQSGLGTLEVRMWRAPKNG